jgi:centractin
MAQISRDVTDYLQLLLRKSGHHLHTSAEREIVRTIKEKTCYVPTNVLKEDKELMGRTEEFRLPDGKVIHVSFIGDVFDLRADCCGIQLGSERYWAPEILFNPELIGSEDPGVPQVSMTMGLQSIKC